jgi:hypothetical protein
MKTVMNALILGFFLKRRNEKTYLLENPDVRGAVDEGTFKNGRAHYLKHGKSEGRIWGGDALIKSSARSNHMNRKIFAEKIYSESVGYLLEIGPLSMPLIEGPRCKYFDIIPTEELRKKALGAQMDPSTVPNIDFWDPKGRLSVIHERFGSVVSAHCIEHQADLINHLNQVSELLTANGKYFLVIPDQRYCFDHFLPPSSIVDIITAHEERREMPIANNIIEHLSLTTHNDARRHWLGDHGSVTETLTERWVAAKNFIKINEGIYVDVHCWQFTPDSFRGLIENLFHLKLINFRCIEIYTTEKNTFEFFAILEKV